MIEDLKRCKSLPYIEKGDLTLWRSSGVKMPVYDVIVTKSEEVAEGTIAFHFAKPSDFAFKAGQFISVSLIEPSET